MKFFKRHKAITVPPLTVAEPVVVNVSLSIMNTVFEDRSAGRWCAHCRQCGNHHTDRHNDFAAAALEIFEARLERRTYSAV